MRCKFGHVILQNFEAAAAAARCVRYNLNQKSIIEDFSRKRGQFSPKVDKNAARREGYANCPEILGDFWEGVKTGILGFKPVTQPEMRVIWMQEEAVAHQKSTCHQNAGPEGRPFRKSTPTDFAGGASHPKP